MDRRLLLNTASLITQVENCIGVAGLPLGVAPNFVVNGQHYVVPMAVEEPSVIAAASGVAKLLSGHGGFTAHSTPNVMTAEVQLCDFPNVAAQEEAVRAITDAHDRLVAEANTFCASMKSRGGGVMGLQAKIVQPRRPRNRQSAGFVIVYIDVRIGSPQPQVSGFGWVV